MINVCITIDAEGDSANNPRSTFLGIEIVLPELLKVLCKYDIKATFFIQEDKICQVGKIYSELWRSLGNQRHEIAYHAHGLIGSSMEEKEEMISRGVQRLRKLGFNPVSFRAGRYHFDGSLLKILEKNNIKYDSSVVPGLRECFGDGTVRCNHIGAPHQPYFLSYENHCREGESSVLELPVNRYPELPPAIGGKLTGKKDNEEVLFDYFYKVRKDKLIIVNVHTWDGLRGLIRRSVRNERYGEIERLAFESVGRILRSDTLISSAYFDRFERLLSYISRNSDVHFTTIEEAASETVIEKAGGIPMYSGNKVKGLYDEQKSEEYRKSDGSTVRYGSRIHYCSALREVSLSFDHKISVLDVGCGTGRYFHCLRNVKRLVGIDISPHMLEQARNPVRKDEMDVEDIELICGDIFDINILSQSFDFIYSLGVLGEFSPLNPYLCSKIFEALKPNGKFFVTIVDTHSRMQRPGDKLLNLEGRIIRKAFPVFPAKVKGHLNRKLSSFYMTKEKIKDVLDRSAFTEYEIFHYKHPIGSGWRGAHYNCLASKNQETCAALQQPPVKEYAKWQNTL